MFAKIPLGGGRNPYQLIDYNVKSQAEMIFQTSASNFFYCFSVSFLPVLYKVVDYPNTWFTRSFLAPSAHFIQNQISSLNKQKQKYRGMFETQKSRNKTSSGDIGLNIWTPASPKVGQDQVSGGVSVLCWHAAPVANVLWKPLAIR